MPELPEVETVRAGLEQHVRGACITSVKVYRRDLRLPVTKGLEKTIRSLRMTRIERRAKYLLIHLEQGWVLVVHLGMSGRLIVRPSGRFAHQTHDHLLFTLTGGQEMVFNDPRRFGLVVLIKEQTLPQHPLFRALGPEPLSEAFSSAYLAEALASRSAPIKTALMDQALVVGVGNIYASEALFRVGIHPQTPAKDCVAKASSLVQAIRDVLTAAIASGGSTLRNYAKASGESGYFQHAFKVYGREGEACLLCKDNVLRITQAGRSSFFCPTCQPLTKRPRRRG